MKAKACKITKNSHTYCMTCKHTTFKKKLMTWGYSTLRNRDYLVAVKKRTLNCGQHGL